jgi:hypothetical protein
MKFLPVSENYYFADKKIEQKKLKKTASRIVEKHGRRLTKFYQNK